MVWKILSGVSAALLGVSLYFSVINSKALKAEKMLADRATKDQATLVARKKEGEELKTKKEEQLAALKKDLEATKEKVAKAAADSQEKDAALQLAKTTFTQVQQQVETIQKKIDELGDVNKLLAQVDTLKQEQKEQDGAVANLTQQIASKKELLASVQADIARYRDLEARSRKGIVEPSFTARVASVFNDWGFVLLNKGNAAGVFANADLEVKRGKDVVAKLKVRNVEQQSAVADIVPGSVKDGDRLRSGDTVVAAANQPAAPTSAPAAGGAAPVPAAGAGATAPAEAAPAPAPAAAAMGGDPFGAAPMPAAAAPAPAAGGDPFGAAPAPAAGGAAPAAGGAGTKENPSTADPFGAAPAKPAAGGADPFAPPPAK